MDSQPLVTDQEILTHEYWVMSTLFRRQGEGLPDEHTRRYNSVSLITEGLKSVMTQVPLTFVPLRLQVRAYELLEDVIHWRRQPLSKYKWGWNLVSLEERRQQMVTQNMGPNILIIDDVGSMSADMWSASASTPASTTN